MHMLPLHTQGHTALSRAVTSPWMLLGICGVEPLSPPCTNFFYFHSFLKKNQTFVLGSWAPPAWCHLWPSVWSVWVLSGPYPALITLFWPPVSQTSEQVQFVSPLNLSPCPAPWPSAVLFMFSVDWKFPNPVTKWQWLLWPISDGLCFMEDGSLGESEDKFCLYSF